jgi:primary-amine oxidase
MHKRLLVAAALGLLIVCSREAAAQGVKPTDCPQSVVASFPTAGPAQTQWDLCYEVMPRYGLVVRRASFQPFPAAPHIGVLSDARLGEIFVPYHSGKPRFYDIKGSNYKLRLLTTKECPPSVGGTLLAASFVCQEVRDSGVAWRRGDTVRRGQELVLWGILQAGNYQYIIEWTFQDDGTFKGQVGSTGPTRRKTPTQGHMHAFTWRVDIDLDGAGGDTAQWSKHHESVGTETATDERVPVATEASLAWNPTEFDSAEISDATLQNANGRRTAYELTPLRSGSPRHKEAFTKADFWVTRYNATELLAANLPSYTNGEAVDGQDVVLWYLAACHHEENMRDEDLITVPVKWVGFTLKPKNLFAGTPLYQ